MTKQRWKAMNDIDTLVAAIIALALLVAVVTPLAVVLSRTRLMDALLPIPEDEDDDEA